MKKIKFTKFSLIFILILLLSFANTLKGVAMIKCGYGLEYWVDFIWKLDDLSQCSTIVNERVKK